MTYLLLLATSVLTTLLAVAHGRDFLFKSNMSIPTAADSMMLKMNGQDVSNLLGGHSAESASASPLQRRQYKCQVLRAMYKTARTKYPTLLRDLESSRITLMLNSCGSRDFRATEVFSQPFIFPGTQWCGTGNVAENYHDLGTFNETDACCRDHDFCDDIIRAGRTKHNLINPYSTTRLHCKCDEALRQCFRNVNSVVSNTVGYIFFSLLQTQCYDFNYPVSGCQLWRRGAARFYCVKYKMEEDQEKQWQWFDQEPFF